MGTFTGDDGNNYLPGTSEDDLILGLGGSDTLEGLGGADILRGGAGDDYLYGGANNDILRGGSDNDSLYGGAGADILDGGSGILDAIYYNDSPAGVVVILGEKGETTVAKGGHAQGDRIKNVEYVDGSNFDDRLVGNSLDNGLYGNDGNDVLKGGGGRDQILGYDDNDRLYGGNGADQLSGGDGNDTLVGGKGRDDLAGDAGDDTFKFHSGFGKDTIIDFVAGAATDDVIWLDKTDFRNFKAVLAASVQDAADVVIKADAHNTITLKNVNLADLHADDFSFF